MPARRVASRRRGGKRKGAGAPRGNVNAVKNGNHSPQVATVRALLTPTVQRVIERLQQAQERAERRRRLAFKSIIDELAEQELREHPELAASQPRLPDLTIASLETLETIMDELDDLDEEDW